MKRRDLIRMVPLSVAGYALSSFRDGTGFAVNQIPVPYARVKNHNGTPALFLDGRPVHYSGMWVTTPSPEHWGHAGWSAEHPTGGNYDTAERMAMTGIHIYTFNVGHEWCGPQEGRSGHFDFSGVEAGFRQILKRDPAARLHLRIQLEQGMHSRGKEGWWQKVYPGECEVTSEGRRQEQSYASVVWRTEAKDFLRKYAGHIRKIGLEKEVIAYQVMAAQSGEWTKWNSAGTEHCGDFSEPMQKHFRAYLSERYHGDINVLRKAWNDPAVSFETAGVPSREEQLQTRHYSFRDPAYEQKVIDYFTCFANLCADLINDFCRTVKEATEDKAMAGVFYGYTFGAAYNQGFFGERQKGKGFYGETGEGNSTAYSKIQRNGHLALYKVLQSPYVDFFVSPASYGFRGMGGDGRSKYPTESLRLHGKLCILEDDVRLHDAPKERLKAPLIYGRTRSVEESITILRRDFGRCLIHGMGIWRAPVADPDLYPTLKKFNELGEFAMHLDRAPSAEIAVIVDEESMIYETPRYNLNLASLPNQLFQGFSRLGAPSDYYLLDDLISGKLRPYKLYVFLNAYRLDSERREKLAREIRRDGRVALWIYAPGYIKDTPSLENMKELTGINYAMGELPWPVFMHVLDFKHPVTRGLPQDFFWNFNAALGPLFSIDDPGAQTLCNIVFSQGCCVPGMGIRVFPEWTSVYCGVPNIPAPVLRGIARYAGVHLYNEQGDVLHASRNLLCVHTISGGEREFLLPWFSEVVYDLFNDRMIAGNTNHFRVNLNPASTELYYTGDLELIFRLNNK